MNPKFHPLEPNRLVRFVVEPVSLFIFQEVVDAINLRRRIDSCSEIEVILEVKSEGHGDKIEIRHGVELRHTFLTQCRRSRLGFEGRADGNNPVNPVERFPDGHPGVAVAAAIDDPTDLDAARIVDHLVHIFEAFEIERKPGVFVRRIDHLARRILLAGCPFSGMVNSMIGNGAILADPVKEFVILDENIGKNDFIGAVQRLPDNRIILGIDAHNDAEHALFHIHGAHLFINDAQIGDVVTDDLFARHHGGGCLAAERRKRARKICHPILRAVHAHHEHVLAEPVFA